jgi:hypothetical protein
VRSRGCRNARVGSSNRSKRAPPTYILRSVEANDGCLALIGCSGDENPSGSYPRWGAGQICNLVPEEQTLDESI